MSLEEEYKLLLEKKRHQEKYDPGLKEISILNTLDVLGEGLGEEVFTATEGKSPETRATLATIARLAPDAVGALGGMAKGVYDLVKRGGYDQLSSVPKNFSQSGSTLVKGTKYFNNVLADRASKMHKKGAEPFETLHETGSLPWKDAKGKDIILQFTDEPSKITKLDDRDFTSVKDMTHEKEVYRGPGISEVVDDTQLNNSYPELMDDLWLAKDPKIDSIASYSPGTDVITLKDIKRPSTDSDIMHEIDHGIQKYTGLQGGADPETMQDFASKILSYTNGKDPYLNQILSKGTSNKVLDELYSDRYRDVGFNLYRNTPGEVLSKIAEGTQKGRMPIETLANSGQKYKDILFESDLDSKIQKIIRGR